MNTYRILGYSLGFLVVVALLGCVAPPPSSPYVPVEERGVATAGFDSADYQHTAQAITDKMKERGLPKGYAVALGPVDTRGTIYAVDVQTIQDDIAVVLDEEGTLRFTSAVMAISGNSAAEEIYKIIEYNWFHNNPQDKEDLEKFGKLANINGILFGRISSLQRDLPRGGTEVTYTCVWRLTSTQTGLDDMILKYTFRKHAR